MTDYPRNPRELTQLLDMLGRVFSFRADALERRYALTYTQDPGVPRENIRVLKRRGKIIASAVVHEKTLRIGRARLRFGGLGQVACERDARSGGLAARCVRDALELIRRKRLPLALLHCTLEHYYSRFGFMGCFNESTLSLNVRELAGLQNPWRVTSMRPGDTRHLKAMLELYHAATVQTPGAIERSPKAFELGLRYREFDLAPPFDDRERGVYLFTDSTKKLRAYIAWHGGALWECMHRPGDDEAGLAQLAWFRDRAIMALEPEIVLPYLSAAHPLWHVTRRFKHQARVQYSPASGYMGMLTNVEALIDSMQPEWSARLSSAGLEHEVHVHLGVHNDLPGADGKPKKAVRLDHNFILNRAHHLSLAHLGARGIAEVRIECSSRDLLRLVFGTLPYEEMPGVRVSGEKFIPKVIFAPQSPYLYRMDAF